MHPGQRYSAVLRDAQRIEQGREVPDLCAYSRLDVLRGRSPVDLENRRPHGLQSSNPCPSVIVYNDLQKLRSCDIFRSIAGARQGARRHLDSSVQISGIDPQDSRRLSHPLIGCKPVWGSEAEFPGYGLEVFSHVAVFRMEPGVLHRLLDPCVAELLLEEM